MRSGFGITLGRRHRLIRSPISSLATDVDGQVARLSWEPYVPGLGIPGQPDVSISGQTATLTWNELSAPTLDSVSTSGFTATISYTN